jgi:hypothetical protein
MKIMKNNEKDSIAKKLKKSVAFNVPLTDKSFSKTSGNHFK